MSFSEHYFVEADKGEELTKTVHQAFGGKATKSNMKRMDDPTSGGGVVRSKDKSDSGDSGDTSEPTKETEPQEEPTKDDKPKAEKDPNKLMSLRGTTPGGHGYLVEDGHELYNALLASINNPEVQDRIISKKPITNKKLFEGFTVTFKPYGENPEEPNKFRTMYVIKNKESKNTQGTPDYSGVVFFGRISFIDALSTFMTGLIQGKSTAGVSVKDVVKDVKWEQRDVKQIQNPYKYANVKVKDIDPDDIAFTTNAVKDAASKKRNESKSFHEFYDSILNEENVFDKMIKGTVKGIGGSLMGLLKRPAKINVNSPSELAKYFPSNSTLRVKEGGYQAVNRVCAESITEWEEAKKEYGLIAQQFVKMKNIYVSKVFELVVKEADPKNPKAVQAYAKAFNSAVKAFKINFETSGFQVEGARTYETTNGGMISTMIISVYDKNVAPAGDEKDAEAVGDTDIKVQDTTKDAPREMFYFVSADSAGSEFFTKGFNADIKRFVGRYNNASKSQIDKAVQNMGDKHDSLVKQRMGGSDKTVFWKRPNVKNAELNAIMKKVEATPELSKARKGPEKNGAYSVTTFTTKNNGKILFVNDGPGSDGRIVISNKAMKNYIAKNIDGTEQQFKNKYKQSKK